MPILNIASIYSFSSEDPAHPAANLLSRTAKKWRCRSADESTAFVCLQLDKPATRITGIDIGNEHSAHISVLVGRLGARRDEDFTEILLATTFMTAAESRNATGDSNRVRCFHNEALIADVAAQRNCWQLVKVVCTQPYDRHRKFGLSMLKVHAEPAASTEAAVGKALVPAAHLSAVNAAAAATSAASPFAKFKFRADSPSDSDGETSAAGLFNRWKQSKATTLSSSSAAGAIRDATASTSSAVSSPVAAATAHFTPKSVTPASSTNSSTDQKPTKPDRNRNALLYDSDDERPNERLDRKLELDRLERERQRKLAAPKTPAAATQQPPSKPTTSRTKERTSDKFRSFLDADVPAASTKHSNGSMITPTRKRTLSPVASTPSSSGVVVQPSPMKRSRITDDKPAAPIVAPPPAVVQRTYRPFRRLLDGVVLVISGIQNPERAQLRDRALALGAKYKPDWAPGCTHLICAFKNTPKYAQVHGRGHIIRKDWIDACHAQQKRLPWRRYALDQADKDAPESEDELWDESLKPAEPTPTTSVVDRRSSPPKASAKTPEKNAVLSSGSDTEDELERVRQRQQKRAPVLNSDSDDDEVQAIEVEKSKPVYVDDDDDVYNRTTDEDTRFAAAAKTDGTAEHPSPNCSGRSNNRSVTPLPEFYAGRRFHLSGNLAAVDVVKLQRFVAVYGGQVIRNAAEADFIVSAKAKQLPAGFPGVVVRPLWVYECNDMEQLLPTGRYQF